MTNPHTVAMMLLHTPSTLKTSPPPMTSTSGMQSSPSTSTMLRIPEQWSSSCRPPMNKVEQLEKPEPLVPTAPSPSRWTSPSAKVTWKYQPSSTSLARSPSSATSHKATQSKWSSPAPSPTTSHLSSASQLVPTLTAPPPWTASNS